MKKNNDVNIKYQHFLHNSFSYTIYTLQLFQGPTLIYNYTPIT